MPDGAVENPQAHEKEKGAEDDEEKARASASELASDEDGKADNDEDDRPVTRNHVSEVDPAQSVEEKEGAQGNEKKSPKNTALRVSR